ncbi:hypothetical protein GCK72_001347 [Caenorhabditis remanei]|uniref:MICOS complex subunit MIC13 n=1 Tax=Caenorhabditis remanei TaxID=31234 RepID=A0A6A5HMR2_CAERE|nr:hypothetical protein GCK72_001347 [Caenorhabditis remanei]KAF1769530.1 hypothetical protein GCK72_001347 [Caenorhabditis remanei]
MARNFRETNIEILDRHVPFDLVASDHRRIVGQIDDIDIGYMRVDRIGSHPMSSVQLAIRMKRMMECCRDMGFLWKTAKLGLKEGLVAGAVKLSIDNDIWSTNNVKGSELYQKLKKYILPGTVVFSQQLPTVEDVQLKAGGTWNNAVDSVCYFLEHYIWS